MKDVKVKTVKVVQYKQPSPLWEGAGYLGALALLAATLVNPGVAAWPAVLTGCLLYWNYYMFRIMRDYVKYVNATEISKLLVDLANNEEEVHKDGTISDSEGLNKEPVDEQEEG